MKELEVLVGLILAATLLAAVARRVGAPYPVFLAIGGALLALVPGAPTFTVLPELALALFVAPIRSTRPDDASPRISGTTGLPSPAWSSRGGPHDHRRRRRGAR
jgi:CPA1 family monovalent cation:H+ antiporter